MTALSLVSNKDLLARMPRLVLAERGSTAEVIQHLVEIDRRRLYLDAACRSLSCYCIERLGYSEDEANKRVRVAQIARTVPQVIDELRSGAIHLTGLWLLAPLLTPDNGAELLVSARGKTRREIEVLIARAFPKPDVPDRISPELEQLNMPAGRVGSGSNVRPAPEPTAMARPPKPANVAPLSESRWSVQLSIGSELKAKIDEAQQLLSHAIPNGDLAALLDRALDALLVQEKKRRFGAGKSRKRRLPKAGSRHVPLELRREVTERDGGQCAYVDEHGNRCSAREYVTVEHRDPWARGGPTTAENLCLLCKAHNHHTARKVFGEAHVEKKILDSEYDRTLSALCKLGFREGEARKALTVLKRTSRATKVKELLVEALAILVPPSPNLHVRESRRPYGLSSDHIACPGTEMAIRSSELAYRTDHDRRLHAPLRRRWPQNERSG